VQPISKHFQIEPLTDGVYAAIVKPGGLAISNAGIVDLGDRVLLFDMMAAPQAARDLIAAAEQLTGHPVRAAVNSHWHFDHVAGNQALPAEATLTSTQLTRDLIADRIPPLIADRREQVPHQLRDLETQLQAEKDPARREEIGADIDFFRLAMIDLPTATVRLPDQTFDQQMTFYGPARRVELIACGGGHTSGDAILYLPDEQIAFVADLVFHNAHPYMGEGDPDQWLRTYDRIEALSPAVEVIVPGHGPVATPDAFAALRRYIPALRQVAADAIKQGGTIDDAAARPIPAAFSSWSGEARFAVNVRYLYQKSRG
jgi:glyoxylase-like metal-dependent hydrolase (beta-lactamase superfamily II)